MWCLIRGPTLILVRTQANISAADARAGTRGGDRGDDGVARFGAALRREKNTCAVSGGAKTRTNEEQGIFTFCF